jgi:hypothetical protein
VVIPGIWVCQSEYFIGKDHAFELLSGYKNGILFSGLTAEKLNI